MSNLNEPTSVFTPDETISIPASSNTEPKTENRFTDRQNRNNCILALEAEFDTFVDAGMYWGAIDEFCNHEGKTYFYKDWIKTNVTTDVQQRANDGSTVAAGTKKVNDFLGYALGGDDALTYEAVRDILLSQPAGFPKLVIETPQFFQCEDVGSDKINIDSIDKPLLDKIKNTFTSDIHPLMADLNDRLYLKDGNVLCTDILAFEYNPNGKLGLLINPTFSEKYDVSKAYFFPFAALTAEQKDIVETFGKIESEGKEVVIVDL